MRQQIPLERLIVLPDRIVVVPEEALIVLNNVSDHQPHESENKIFWTKA